MAQRQLQIIQCTDKKMCIFGNFNFEAPGIRLRKLTQKVLEHQIHYKYQHRSVESQLGFNALRVIIATKLHNSE